jgi:AraC-like DNA-binding protein
MRTADWEALAREANYRVTLLAEKARMPRRTLYRAMQWRFRKAPKAWLAATKLSAACQLIAAGEPIKNVARQLGYGHPSNFSRFIKRTLGASPKALRPGHSGKESPRRRRHPRNALARWR